MIDENRAPGGCVWVCLACGRLAKDRFGEGVRGWGPSCAMNSVLCREDKVVVEDGRAIRIDHGGVEADDRPLEETTTGHLAPNGGGHQETSHEVD